MPDVSSTNASRNFADLLDAVERRGETFTIVRRGRAVAELAPFGKGRGVDVKTMLRRHRPDPTWTTELSTLRNLTGIEDRA